MTMYHQINIERKKRNVEIGTSQFSDQEGSFGKLPLKRCKCDHTQNHFTATISSVKNCKTHMQFRNAYGSEMALPHLDVHATVHI